MFYQEHQLQHMRRKNRRSLEITDVACFPASVNEDEEEEEDHDDVFHDGYGH